MKKLFFGALAALTLAAGGTFAGTLDDVKARGSLLCGVSTGAPGFATVDDSGKDIGFDVDYCRAVAAAIFGDPMAVKFVGLTSSVRFTALAAGEVDILARNTTWTYSRDTDLKQTFLGVNYYDGQGFMVKKELGVSSAKELDGATVCVQVGTTTELNLSDFFKENGMSYEPVPTADNAESQQQYLAGACDTYTTDASALHGTRVNLEKPDDHLVLPEIISKEPLGPLVRHGDDNWADVGRWVLNALVIAEEVDAGGYALNPRGAWYDKNSVVTHLARRNQREELREAGLITGGPAPFSTKDTQAFAREFDQFLSRWS